MPEDTFSAEEKERRRKKQYKRMSKILGKLWELDESTNIFQDRPSDLQNVEDDSNEGVVLCLTDIGQKIDNQGYRFGRHGWEDFAKDLGGVYNHHIRSSGKTKAAQLAKNHLDTVTELLGSIETSLVKLAKEHTPETIASQSIPKKGKSTRNSSGTASEETENKQNNKKRKQSWDNETTTSNKHDRNNNGKKAKQQQQHTNKNSELAEREARAMDLLTTFVIDNGGNRNLLSGYRARVTSKRPTSSQSSNNSSAKYDVVYFNESGRRFRSMLEVGRFLNIIQVGAKSVFNSKKSNFRRNRGLRNPTTKEQEIEIKQIRKEIEKLRKLHTKATKNLDDLMTSRNESIYPIDDRMLVLDEGLDSIETPSQSTHNDQAETDVEMNKATFSEILTRVRATCAGACVPDMVGFHGIPQHYTPDLLMTWDFLCTFERALSLTPISLDDFASALVYVPPSGQTGDDIVVPPVYIVEAHLSLLKLLLQDRTSDEWWWSTLESNELEHLPNDTEFDENEDDGKVVDNKRPIIKINISQTLLAVEDPLITTSWMRELEHVGQDDSVTKKSLKSSIKAALKFVSNKWVAAYLRKVVDLSKSQGINIAKNAVQYLVETFLEARPDLGDRAVHKETVNKARTRVIEEASKAMESLLDSVPVVNDADVVSDFELDDDSDNDSDDEYQNQSHMKDAGDHDDESKKRVSTIPPKPLPSLVDLLLPPAKPKHNSDLLDPFTWSHIVGAAIARYIHRKKRLLNEIDDSLRDSHVLRPLTIAERREREKLVTSRILTECGNDNENGVFPLEKATEHLCRGGNYLDLTPIERLSVLRILIEAAYDTVRLMEVVGGNYKQRVTAMKSLELEQRRAKKEAKEKAAADEAAAREKLAAEAREAFLDSKREEIRELNDKSKEFSDDIIESLTDEDIIDFDDDIRAEYDALPTPESFSKTDVGKMIRKMQELSAFDTDSLRILTMAELIQREKVELEEMEGQLSGFGGEDALYDQSLDRETLRSIERLQRDVDRAKNLAKKLPALREKALEQLTDAIQNGTVKVLRTAFTNAKKAKLCGVDDETGGLWAVDVMRDAAIELENAKQNKRLLDAQRDLVAKLKKCFIRTEPIGHDRCENRFWMFDNDEVGHTWVEAEFDVLSSSANDEIRKVHSGFLDLSRSSKDIGIGANDMEEDLVVGRKQPNITVEESFINFSRLEYHSSGQFPCLTKSSWGCHTTEDSLREVMKQLDSRGIHENELKERLKESLEHVMVLNEKNEVHEPQNSHGVEEHDQHGQEHDENETTKDAVIKTCSDEGMFLQVKDAYDGTDDITKVDICKNSDITTAIGLDARIRKVVEETKNTKTARYENGTITGWKLEKKIIVTNTDDTIHNSDEEELDEKKNNITEQVVDNPLWCVKTDHGHVMWLDGCEVLESIARYKKWNSHHHGYYEHDSAFLSYRNHLGRFCGKAIDAPYTSSPSFFAKLMIKRESDLYPKLKLKSYHGDHNINQWGGQSGSRALWTNSMKDYAYDFQTVRQGLLTLENAFFELSGKFTHYPQFNNNNKKTKSNSNNNNSSEDNDDNDNDHSSNDNEIVIDGKALLYDTTSRFEIELESIEKGVVGIWNSPTSRAVYIAIVSESQTTGILALALDLLVRNTIKYLQTHKLLSSAAAATLQPSNHSASGTTSRNSNSYRTATTDSSSYYSNNNNNEAYGGGTSTRPVRSTRRMNAWQQKQQQQHDDDYDEEDNYSDEDWK